MIPRRAAHLAGAAFVCLVAGGAGVPEPDTYRMEAYRTPVPATLEGVTVVGVDRAHALWEGGDTLFVDVLPRAPRPAGLPEGTIFRQKQRRSIPGAIWLVNVGYGRLAPPRDAYFRDALAEATGGDPAHSVLFFCLADCWMSWNAAKRAREEYGYTRVYWFPEGTDAWEFMGHPLAPLEPEEVGGS